MRVIHPPPAYLAYAIAANGQAAVPAVAGRLRGAADDFEKSDLLAILESMVCFENVNLQMDPATMDVIDSAVATVNLPAAKVTAETRRTTIRDGCAKERAGAAERLRDLHANRDSGR